MIRLIQFGKHIWADLNRRESRRLKRLNRTRRKTRPGLYLFGNPQEREPTIYLVTGYSRHYRRYSARMVAIDKRYEIKKNRKNNCVWPYIIWLPTLNSLKRLSHKDLVLYTHLKHGRLFDSIISGQYKRLEA